ncbi:AcrR family transcriptional regulator [Microbacterium resistens]|uniref:AcrR family transcriptional regulator n=1 Tax=Microbacterium resistens TaxID=156977 RepID=A0ABU1SAH7_9MICO|nr:TetR/AcrR family transcriptional regulator [Microbacterium resistens]MDR6866608.1 AcrR family transcriptional regulator [Microbacterium resistens]
MGAGITAMATPARTGRAARGRPRVHDDEVILRAALELMSELGYQRLTLQDIATRSGVSVPSIYRRWANKAEVVSAAVALTKRTQIAPTGDVEADLLAQLRDIRRMYEEVTDIGMTGTLLAEERHHPEFIQAWRRAAIGPRRAAIEGIVRRGQEQGVVAPDVDAHVVPDLLAGAFYAARIAGTPLDETWDRTVVGLLLGGIRLG